MLDDVRVIDVTAANEVEQMRVDQAVETDQKEAAAEQESETEQAEEQQEQAHRKMTATERVHQSRQQTRLAREQLEDERRDRKEFETKVQARLDALLATKAPDPDIDPDGFMKHQQEETAAVTKERDDLLESQNTAQEQQRGINKIKAWLTDTIDDYKEDHPDFDDAQQYLIELDVKRLMEEQGATREDAEAEVLVDLGNLARTYYAKGRNPCAFLYTAAKKVGYKLDSSAAQTQKKTDTGDLKVLSAGQTATRTTKGSGPNTQLTVEDLAAMTDEEFQKHTSDPQKLRRFFGE